MKTGTEKSDKMNRALSKLVYEYTAKVQENGAFLVFRGALARLKGE